MPLGQNHSAEMVPKTSFRSVACSASDAITGKGRGVEGEIGGVGGRVRGERRGIGVTMACKTSGRIGVGRRDR